MSHLAFVLIRLYCSAAAMGSSHWRSTYQKSGSLGGSASSIGRIAEAQRRPVWAILVKMCYIAGGTSTSSA